jgi:hypothetical protein
MAQQKTVGALGKYWVEGKWMWCMNEALKYARRKGAKHVYATDGWTPTAVIAWA